jgi:general secretion pathway protein G
MVRKSFSVLRCSSSVLRERAVATPHTKNEQRTTNNATPGFTLLELLIVMTIIAILAAIAIPSFTANVKHAREAVLKEDLHTMRSAIDSYTYDKQKAPQDLNDLVQSGYLKELPVDPFTQRKDTWIVGQSDSYQSLDETQSGGIDDVHSGSQQVSTEGTTYNTW